MFEKTIEFQAKQAPDGVAHWSPQGEVTFRQFERHIAQFTTAFMREGLRPGELALLHTSRSNLHWLATLALERLGVPTVYGGDDLAEVCRIAQPEVFIVGNASAVVPAGKRLIRMDQAWLKAALSLPPSPRQTPACPDDLVRIVLSSGTTGEKKQIPLTRRVVDARMLSAVTANRASAGVRFLQIMGTDTASGFSRPLSTWNVGGTMIFNARIDEDLLRRTKPNICTISPQMLQKLLEPMSCAFTAQNPIRVLVSGGAMPPALVRKVLACEGIELMVLYGSTEAGVTSFGSARLALDRPGAVGFVAPWAELEVLGEDGAPLAPGRVGELRMRGIAPSEPYRGVKDGQAGVRDGWFYPGDLGFIDSDGALIVEGRADDLINVGGVKLAATKIEHVVLDCAGVDDVAVLTLPMSDGKWVVFAAVAGAGYSEDDIRKKVWASFRANIAIVQLSHIERNGMGKIVRRSVRDAIIHQQGQSMSKSA